MLRFRFKNIVSNTNALGNRIWLLFVLVRWVAICVAT